MSPKIVSNDLNTVSSKVLSIEYTQGLNLMSTDPKISKSSMNFKPDTNTHEKLSNLFSTNSGSLVVSFYQLYCF